MPGLTRHPAGARLRGEKTSLSGVAVLSPFALQTQGGWIPHQVRDDGQVVATKKAGFPAFSLSS
jgi:hypothetical protein